MSSNQHHQCTKGLITESKQSKRVIEIITDIAQNAVPQCILLYAKTERNKHFYKNVLNENVEKNV